MTKAVYVYASKNVEHRRTRGCLRKTNSHSFPSGRSPFLGTSPEATCRNILSGDLTFPVEYFASVTQEACDLIHDLLAFKPEDRVELQEALSHPWFKMVRLLSFEVMVTEIYPSSLHLVFVYSGLRMWVSDTNYISHFLIFILSFPFYICRRSVKAYSQYSLLLITPSDVPKWHRLCRS